MKVLSSKFLSLFSHHRGVYVPFVALSMVILLAFVGLALDAGHAFVVQIRLQRSVDAGAIGAMGLLKLRPANFVRDLAREFTRENMVRSGLSPDRQSAVVNVTVNTINNSLGQPMNQRINVVGQATSPLSFLRVLPGMPPNINLVAQSIAGLPPMAVVLVLDRSGSMDSALPGQTLLKIDALKEAAKRFIAQLDSGDWFAVVTFSSSSYSSPTTNIPLTIYNPAQLATYEQIIEDDIDALGGTCIACGIYQGRQVFLAPPPGFPAGIRKFMLVMTDGSPQHESGDNTFLQNNDGLPASLPSHQRTSCGHQNGETYSNDLQFPIDLNDPPPAGRWNGGTGGRGGTGDIYRTIWQSDKARSEGITIHTVGLGGAGENFCWSPQPTGGNRAPERPWQPQACYNGNESSQIDTLTMRPYLLRRLANALTLDLPCPDNLTIAQKTAAIPPPSCEGPAAPKFKPRSSSISHPHCQPQIGPDKPRGISLETPNASELTDAFNTVFAEIKKARLVE